MGELAPLLWLCLGASAVYTGGMFLNDAFDVEYDQQHRRERPIPSGTIALRTVWIAGFLWLALGAAILLGPTGAHWSFVLLLVLSVVVYDAIHKAVVFSPLLMAVCRYLLYLAAGSAAAVGVEGLVVWSALVMGAYIAGLSYFARRESTHAAYAQWPLLLLFAPLVLAAVVNTRDYRWSGLMMSGTVGLWIFWSLRGAFRLSMPSLGRTVSRLLAGIILVDWLAVGWINWPITAVFVALFVAALLFQRFIPAT